TGSRRASEGGGAVERSDPSAGSGPVPRSGASSPASSVAPGADSSAVLRNSAESGPSRMLARLAFVIREDLLRELPVRVRGHPVGIVFENRHALDGGLREAHRLANTRCEDLVAEVL